MVIVSPGVVVIGRRGSNGSKLVERVIMAFGQKAFWYLQS